MAPRMAPRHRACLFGARLSDSSSGVHNSGQSASSSLQFDTEVFSNDGDMNACPTSCSGLTRTNWELPGSPLPSPSRRLAVPKAGGGEQAEQHRRPHSATRPIRTNSIPVPTTTTSETQRITADLTIRLRPEHPIHLPHSPHCEVATIAINRDPSGEHSQGSA